MRSANRPEDLVAWKKPGISTDNEATPFSVYKQTFTVLRLSPGSFNGPREEARVMRIKPRHPHLQGPTKAIVEDPDDDDDDVEFTTF
ncbi:unnamed protein product, partial [Iphiclides podalirius]